MGDEHHSRPAGARALLAARPSTQTMSVGDAWGLIIVAAIAFWCIGAVMGRLTERDDSELAHARAELAQAQRTIVALLVEKQRLQETYTHDRVN